MFGQATMLVQNHFQVVYLPAGYAPSVTTELVNMGQTRAGLWVPQAAANVDFEVMPSNPKAYAGLVQGELRDFNCVRDSTMQLPWCSKYTCSDEPGVVERLYNLPPGRNLTCVSTAANSTQPAHRTPDITWLPPGQVTFFTWVPYGINATSTDPYGSSVEVTVQVPRAPHLAVELLPSSCMAASKTGRPCSRE